MTPPARSSARKTVPAPAIPAPAAGRKASPRRAASPEAVALPATPATSKSAPVSTVVAEAGSESAAPELTTAPHGRGPLAAAKRRLHDLRQPPASPHETRGASIVRPVVFGATDGLVCNLSLIMGVAGAAGEAHAIVIAGIAGLLAGGFSMAVGEFVSVRSQRELLEYQIELQRHQLHHTPEQERDILCEIYEAKGLSRAESELIVKRIMNDPERAIDTFVREEIGLSAETMGSPVAAGLGSLCAFALGAFVPLLPFLVSSGAPAFAFSIAASGLALFAVGLGVSRLTHRHAIWTGVRQTGLGGLAAAVTFGIGSLLGTAVR
jgi:vacuolar iron transporter family protein